MFIRAEFINCEMRRVSLDSADFWYVIVIVKTVDLPRLAEDANTYAKLMQDIFHTRCHCAITPFCRIRAPFIHLAVLKAHSVMSANPQGD